MNAFVSEILKVPEGEWVVLSADQTRIIAHDPILEKALQKARSLGEKNGVILKAEAVGRSLVIPVL